MRNPQCTLCPRHQSAKNICLFGNTLLSSSKEIMVIIDSVTSNSDTTGIVTSGQSGNVLIKLFTEAGIIDKVYITPAVKCYSPYKVKTSEVKSCRRYIAEEIKEINPKLIICLGAISIQAIFGKNIPIKKLRQRIFEFGPYKVACAFSHQVIFSKQPDKFNTLKQDIRWILNNYERQTKRTIITYFNQTIPNNCSNVFGFDIESTGLNVFSNKLLLFSLSPVGTDIAYSYNIGYEKYERSVQILSDVITNIFSNPNIILIGHTIKFDIKFIEKYFGIKVKCKLIDIAILHYLLDENSLDNALKNLAAIYTDFGHYEDEVNRSNLAGEDFKKVIRYNAIDSIVPHKLFQIFWPQIVEQKLDTIAKFLFEIIPILADMEMIGIYVNISKVKKLYDDCLRRLQELQNKYIQFDFKKPYHIAKLLYDVAKIQRVQKTKTGRDSSSKDTLNLLKFLDLNTQQREVLNDVLSHRSVMKRLTLLTGDRGFIPNIIDSRLHTTYNLSKSITQDEELRGTVTGRLSSSNPNLQNVPNKDNETGAELRGIFEVTPGWKYLVTPDYSQIELRVAAFLSREPTLIKAFNEKYDVHTSVMCDLLHEDYHIVNKILKDKYPPDKYQVFHDYRLVIKRLNFGILYGIWIEKLLKVLRNMELDLTEKEAEDLIHNWYKKNIVLLDWIKKTEDKIIKEGYIRSIFGRKRRLIGANRHTAYGKRLLRQGINFPIQSAASDICLIGIRELYQIFDFLRTTGKIDKDSRLNLTVHDQIICETRMEDKDSIKIIVETAMIEKTIITMKERFGINFDIPLEIDVTIDVCWR